LPRDLGDVLDFFLPESEPSSPERSGAGAPATGSEPPLQARSKPLPVLALPMESGDVLRAALAWNLAVEVARLGGHATVVARQDPGASRVWPEPGRGPLGAELVQPEAQGIDGLLTSATEAASRRAASTEGGLVLLCAPLSWLRRATGLDPALRWALLFSRTEPRELLETYALIKALLRRPDPPRVGLTIHAAHSVDAARSAFSRVADVSHRHLGRSPVSYGLLVDDLHVYRAIVAQRPIGLEHPQSPAARALRDVAELLLMDARNESLG
jgi:hypothetical protein